LSCNEIMLAYIEEHSEYYRKDGRSTGELELVKYALKFVKRLYGHRAASEFGPLALKTVRDDMIAAGLCRRTINNQVGRIKRVFRWATANELVPPSVYQGLQAVPGLRRGRSAAKETEPVRPVPEEHVEAVLGVVPAPVGAMIRLQLLTGMRPGEVVTMRGRDIDRTGEVWTYVPESHKTEHHGQSRFVHLGPKAQAVVRPFLKADPDGFLFSARDAEEARQARRRLERVSPMTPSQAKRKRKRNRERAPGGRYTVKSYRRCVARACEGLDVPSWHPHQLRHNAGTRLRKEYGIEAARVVLGHRSAAVTEIYAEMDQAAAARIMASVG
jgi:integrase